MIWESAKKTDKEDALKIAKFIRRYPDAELPLASLPTEKEEELRQLISMKQFLAKTRTALINRLYALAGKTRPLRRTAGSQNHFDRLAKFLHAV